MQGDSDRTARRVLRMVVSIRLQRGNTTWPWTSHALAGGVGTGAVLGTPRNGWNVRSSVAESLSGLGRDAEAAAEAREALQQMNELSSRIRRSDCGRKA